jgi:hypothetical protein
MCARLAGFDFGLTLTFQFLHINVVRHPCFVCCLLQAADFNGPLQKCLIRSDGVQLVS